MMSKKVVLFLIVILLGGMGFVTFKYINKSNEELKKENLAQSNFDKVNNYLKKLKSNYPIPKGDIILLNKKGEEIHLEDRKTPLSKIKGLYAIQGTTCDIFKNSKEFNKINYDPYFSILKDNKAGGEVLFKKCFSYSVTKDRKYYQIGTIKKVDSINYKTIIKGNIKKSITRAYDSPVLVKNNDSNFLPYSPEKVSPIVKIKNIGTSSLKANIENQDGDELTLSLKEGVNKLLTGDLNQKFQINIEGNIDKSTSVSFIDTNGSIIYLKSNDNGEIKFSLNDYKIDTKRLSYTLEAGKFLASIVRLDPKKEMNVSHRGTTLVIRGTKFSIESSENEFNTFLVLGNILQKLSNGKSLNLTRLSSASVLVGNKLVENMEKIKKLIAYVVYSDIKTLPKYDYNILGSDALTGIISPNNVVAKYSNGQKIALISINKNQLEKYFNENIKINSRKLDPSLDKNTYNKIKAICKNDNDCISKVIQSKKEKIEKEFPYINFVKNTCSKIGYKGLDIDKLHYILENNNDNIFNGFELKPDIANKIIGNYIILTARNAGVNGSSNNSTRVGFVSNGSIIDIPLPKLKDNNGGKININNIDIDKVLVACEK